MRGCEEIKSLEEEKLRLLQFIEGRMSKIAPNVCILIGSRIAAQLVGITGGLVALSKIPSCNLQVVGQEKKYLSGFSKMSAIPHTGKKKVDRKKGIKSFDFS
jgi:U4/U6 small nuclear ribonucleoprotein PRP31